MRKYSLFMAVVLTLSCLGGCAQPEETQALPWTPGQAVELRCNVTEGGATLVLDRTVTLPEAEAFTEATLVYSTQARQAMLEELGFTDGARERQEGSSRDWTVWDGENFRRSLMTERAGRVYYLDVERDLNGSVLDEDSTRSEGYITSLVPGDLEISAQEAAQTLKELVERYTCLTYETWNVQALQTQDGRGDYSVELSPIYNGLPIAGQYLMGGHVSREGVFTFQGWGLWEEQARRPIVPTCTLEAAAEKLAAAFSGYVPGSMDRVTVEEVSLQYRLELDIDNVVTLHPAWVFECTQHQRDGSEFPIAFSFDLEDGHMERIHIF